MDRKYWIFVLRWCNVILTPVHSDQIVTHRNQQPFTLQDVHIPYSQGQRKWNLNTMNIIFISIMFPYSREITLDFSFKIHFIIIGCNSHERLVQLQFDTPSWKTRQRDSSKQRFFKNKDLSGIINDWHRRATHERDKNVVYNLIQTMMFTARFQQIEMFEGYI